ncbi:MAG TPA: trypsin-like peptidase domain-containing protein [Bacilli bacterium]|nr:trypsin-like peptidase domain-containing protein [Bacilli bacterium]
MSRVKKGNQRARVTKKAKPATKGTRTVGRMSAGNIPNIVDRYKHAVVNIEVVKRERRSSSRRRQDPWGLFDSQDENDGKNTMNIGTGFFFDPRGYILTNEHVIHNADEIYVRLFDQEEGLLAEVVGTDYGSDLAILKVIPPKRCKTLPLAMNKKVRVGEWVVAIGCLVYAIRHTFSIINHGMDSMYLFAAELFRL